MLSRLLRLTGFSRSGSSRQLFYNAAPFNRQLRIGFTFTAFFGGAYLLSRSAVIANEDQVEGITVEQVKLHNNKELGFWVVLNGKVYDLSAFKERHPGGAPIIEQYAGQDASLIFNEFHAKNFPEKYLSEDECLGPLIGEMELAPNVLADNNEERLEALETKPPLSAVVSATDFEFIARRVMTPLGWNYFAGGTEDEISLRENHNAYTRVYFKPRNLRSVKDTDLSTTMLGEKVSLPIYCSAAAMAKLGHPEGELSIARACGKKNVMQMICHQASYPFSDIYQQVRGQPQWAQVIPLSIDFALQGIKEAENAGVKSIFVTCDVPVIGKRDRDMRFRSTNANAKGVEELNKAGIVFDETAAITWEDFQTLQDQTSVPLMIKGLQSVDDIVLAAERGVKAVVISNHGGRQLDFSRPPLEILCDVVPILKERGLADKIELYVDGGVRRGSDILKALCLGAKGVGLGRMFLFANACYGEEGVTHLINILENEMLRDMKMLGVNKVSELGPEYVDTRSLYMRSTNADFSYQRNYIPIPPPVFKYDE